MYFTTKINIFKIFHNFQDGKAKGNTGIYKELSGTWVGPFTDAFRSAEMPQTLLEALDRYWLGREPGQSLGVKLSKSS